MPCSKAQYWDELLQSCKPCRLACHASKFKACADFCSSVNCSKRVGFYYDSLLRECISCSSVCGQHPTECQAFCFKTNPRVVSDVSSVGKQEILDATLPSPAALRNAQCRMDFGCDPWMVAYVVLGLCLCSLLFSLLVTWIYYRKRGEEMICRASTAACRKKGESKKEGLMEAGSGSSGSRTPEAIETCVFCFPEASPAVQESQPCPRTYQLGMEGDVALTGNPGAIPIPEDGHFQIICSPSQEKMHVT
uniref:Tumor necrosis factor receptor superfamily member 13B n=1 Tax=Pogona vitticeps TaxID=103695 RepID=A0ABM5EZP6_9SAUR